MTPRLLFIVPAFNEEANVGSVVRELLGAFPGADVVVVDDGSTDRTAGLATSAGAVVLRLPTNLGIGAAVQTGLLFADRHDYEIAVQFDADGQHRADQVAVLIQPLIDGQCDAVVGSRFLLRDGRYAASLPRRPSAGSARAIHTPLYPPRAPSSSAVRAAMARSSTWINLPSSGEIWMGGRCCSACRAPLFAKRSSLSSAVGFVWQKSAF